MVEISENSTADRPTADMTIVKNIKDVTHEDSATRIKASMKVLQSARNPQSFKYALTRIIRGTGATLTNSKVGYYTLLSGFLKENASQVSCSDIFEVMDQELKITNKAKTRETSDAYVGRVLTMTAMIRQNIMSHVQPDQLKQCIQIIVETTKLKSYHSRLAYNALIALVQSEITEGQMKASVLPVIKSEMKLTWNEHTMSSVHFILEFKWRFPKLASEKFLRESFDLHDILSPDCFEHIYRIFWHEQSESSIMQPSYDALAKYATSSGNLVKFAKFLSQKLESANSRNKEVITIKVLTEIINGTTSGEIVPKILSTPIWVAVFQSAKKVKPTDEILRAVYLEFFEAIYNVIGKADPSLQLSMIRKLLMRPGSINVDKYAVTNKIVSRSINILQDEVLCKLAELMQNIVTEKEPKGSGNESWLYTEKVTALSYLQKVLHNKRMGIEQKTNSLKWLAMHGLFEEPEITVTPDLADQIKRLFYKTLESPFIKINEEKSLLVELMTFIETHKNSGNVLRQPLEKPDSKLWAEVLKETQKKDNGENQVMFQVLLIHMALQLFSDADLATNAIKELRSCMQRATTISLRRKKNSAQEGAEPEWTEVMVDLILHLLSQNSSILRNVVKKVFPNICAQLNLSAVHQILNLLDMNEENPLLDQDDADEEQEEEDDDASMNSEGEADDDDMEDDEEEEDDENDQEASVSDQMRNALSMALMAGKNMDDDQDSIDLDTMTEEEGQRLDEALANAFKMMPNRRSNEKNKKDNLEATALLHFRNRVIDLLIIYLKSGPELVVVSEILSVLYKMLDQYSDENDAEMALFTKVQEAIDVAVATKIPQNITGFSKSDLVNYMRALMSKCVNPKGIEERSLALQKIVRFFTQIDEHLPVDGKKSSTETLTEVLSSELKAFLTQRTPIMGLNIFQHILQSNWKGIWHQLDIILTHGTSKENRVFKRAQSLDLLRTFQKNTRFLKMADAKDVDKFSKKAHRVLGSYADLVGEKVTPKEFRAYIQLLLDVRVFHQKNTMFKSYLDWTAVGAHVKRLRESTALDAQCLALYTQLCKLAGWEVVKENKVVSNEPESTNGHDGDENQENGAEGKKRKRPDAHANLKQKKLKKEKRFKVSSNGLDETIHFTEMK